MAFHIFQVLNNRAFIKDIDQILSQVRNESAENAQNASDGFNKSRLGAMVVTPSSLHTKEFARIYSQVSTLPAGSLSFMQKELWISYLWARTKDTRKIIDSGQRFALLRSVFADLSKSNELGEQARTFYSFEGNIKRLSGFIGLFGAFSGSKSSRFDEMSNEPLLLARSLYAKKLEENNFIELFDAMSILSSSPQKTKGITVFVGFQSISNADLDLIIAQAGIATSAFVVADDSQKEELCYSKILSSKLNEKAHERGVDSFTHKVAQERVANRETAIHFAQGRGAQTQLVIEEAQSAINDLSMAKTAIIVRKAKRNVVKLADALVASGVAVDLDLRLRFEDAYFGASFMQLISLVSVMQNKEAEPSDGHALLAHLQEPFYAFPENIRHEFDKEVKTKRYHAFTTLTKLCDENNTLRARDERSFNKITLLARTVVTRSHSRDWEELANAMMKNYLSLKGRGRVETILNTAAHHRILAALSEVSSSIKDSKTVQAKDLLAALRGSQITITEGSGGQSKVLLSDARRVQDREFSQLIWLETSTEEYGTSAAVHPDEQNFLYESKTISHEGEEIFDYELKALEEAYFIRQTLEAAKDKVSFIYQFESETGAAHHPAPPIAKLLREERFAPHAESGDKAKALRERGHEVYEARDLENLSRLFTYGSRADLKGATAPLAPGRGSLENRLSLWGEGSATEPGFSERIFSPSAIERYAKCPYGWFVNRYLPSEGLKHEADFRLRGTMIHEFISRFYQAWHEKQGTNEPVLKVFDDKLKLIEIDATEILAEVDEIFDALELDEEWMKHNLHKPPTRAEEYRLLDAKLKAKDRIRMDMKNLPLSIPDNRKSHFEIQVGKEKELQIEGLKLRGRIDRLDTSESPLGPSLIVYDYKGSIETKYAFLDQLKIQAPLYLILASEEYERIPQAYYYLSYSGSGSKGEGNPSYYENLIPEGLGSEKEREKFFEALSKGTRVKEENKSMSLDESLEEVKRIVAELKPNLEAGAIGVALKESAGQRILSNKDKECDYCAYKNCIVKQRVFEAISKRVEDESEDAKAKGDNNG